MRVFKHSTSSMNEAIHLLITLVQIYNLLFVCKFILLVYKNILILLNIIYLISQIMNKEC